MTRRTALTWVAILFIASLLIRIPFLRRPLDGQHDWLNLHTLLTVSIWNAASLQASHYSLIMTWPNDADRFISYFDPRATVEDSKGNSYFVAFPPFAFLLAFWFFKFFHLAPSAVWLRCINLTLLLPATFCLYLMLERLFPKDRVLVGRWLSVLGVALFLFDRSVLLSLGSLYFPLILIVPIWIVSLFVYCSIQDSQQLSPAVLAGFFALVFVMCYCDWLGFAAAGTFFLGAIFSKAPARTNLWLAVVSAIASLAAAALTVMQYASIGGWRAFLSALLFRFKDRAGLTAHAQGGYKLWSPHSYVAIANLYVEQHAALLLMFWGLACFWLLSQKKFSLSGWTPADARLLFMFGLPVIADHVLLVNHTAIHNYANLKATPLLTVIFVLFLRGAIGCGHRAADHGSGKIVEKPLLVRATVLTGIACLISAATYLHARYDIRPTFSKPGNSIRRLAKPDQVVFLVKRDEQDYVTPNLVYFSGRNIQMIENDDQAAMFLQAHHEHQGIIFHAAEEGDVTIARVIVEP